MSKGYSIGGRNSMAQKINSYIFTRDLREMSDEALDKIIADINGVVE